MSLSGVLNTHLMFAYMLRTTVPPAQKERCLPAMARGEHRAALCLTEAHAGSDVQRIRTVATRATATHYVVNGTKMFVTNARTATIYSLVCKTDPDGRPAAQGHDAVRRREGSRHHRQPRHRQARLQGHRDLSRWRSRTTASPPPT